MSLIVKKGVANNETMVTARRGEGCWTMGDKKGRIMCTCVNASPMGNRALGIICMVLLALY